MEQRYGLIPEEPITYITHAFLHTDSGHLTGNMLFLTFFGWLSEKRLAPKWLIGTAGVATVISACASVFLVPDEKWPQEINPWDSVK